MDERSADMAPMIAGVALAAGSGTRLAPITESLAKPCCEVGATTLLDAALDRLGEVAGELAVNAHHHADQIVAAVAGRAITRVEAPVALGTAGALANLRDWIDGRAVAVVNADTWFPGSVGALVGGWDGTTARVAVPGGGEFGPSSAVVGSLVPWSMVVGLDVTPTGLYEVVWRPAQEVGLLEVVGVGERWLDCGTPERLLAANHLAAAADPDGSCIHPSSIVVGSVTGSGIGAGAAVRGDVVHSAVFAGATVDHGERLDHCIRWRVGERQFTIALDVDVVREIVNAGGGPPR